MAWSTPVVAPPDGSMKDYMASLRKLAARPESIYLPGHGGVVRQAQRFVRSYIHHRQAREAAILRRLGKGETDIPAIVGAIYIGIYIVVFAATGLVQALTHSFALAEIASAPISLVSSTFIALLFAIYYFDVRVRREGLDMQSALDRLE